MLNLATALLVHRKKANDIITQAAIYIFISVNRYREENMGSVAILTWTINEGIVPFTQYMERSYQTLFFINVYVQPCGHMQHLSPFYA